MNLKKLIYLLAILALAAGPAWAQVEHISDDREMFVGVGDTSKILPNIMILADNSGSMNTAIYHPAYNSRIDYTQINSLDLDVTNESAPPTGTGVDLVDEIHGNVERSIVYIGSPALFNICRGEPHYVITYDVRGYYAGLYRNNPRTWNVNKNSGTFAVGQTIMYDGNTPGNEVVNRATITAIVDMGSYWRIRVDTGTIGFGGNPAYGTPLYVNYQQTIDFTDSTQANFVPVGDSCAGYDQQFSNVKLYGNSDGGNYTRYDRNYLYWLAFYATQEELDEVTYWATTGMFPNAAGTPVYYGYYRIQVERQVLADVISDVYTTVNLGLTVFENQSNPAGGTILEPMSNVSNIGAFLVHINGITADTWTPLAETMADIWYYYKGGTGGSYWPNNGSNSNCGSGSDGSFPTSCPIQYTCQKNYVIVMTDGQSTQDKFDNAEYAGSYFKSVPISTWGDPDNHDNADLTPNPNGTNLDGTPYCPLNTCWETNGSDLLDDMAWFMKHNDLFPDALYPDMPGDQSIETFVIGFNMDNDLLKDTARNGNGEYYTASSYDTLKNALKDAITNILLRNFGFAAFTAPKKITSTVGEGFSFIGYFLPSAGSSIWEGHLQSYRMTSMWCRDLNMNGILDGDDCLAHYDTQSDCETNLPAGVTCMRSISLSSSSQWDASEELSARTLPRKLYTHNSGSASPYALIDFTNPANIATLQTLFGLPVDPDPMVPTFRTQAESIVSTISAKTLGDVFHSDIAYVGPPMPGKKYLKNLNPSECDQVNKAADADCFENLLASQGVNPDVPGSGRAKVIYVGSNDGILHCVDARETRDVGGGTELWGFIPDEVLPALKKIVVDNEYTFTVDGRVTADDIYYRGTSNSWKTIVVFGLKDGGPSFYALDATLVGTQPSVLWKFNDPDYSGKSWSKPFIGKIRYLQGTAWIDRWVVIVAGGMAFNYGNGSDTAGKAVFVIDASSGELIWMIGYKSTGAADNAGTVDIDTVLDSTYTGPGVRYITAKADFNYPIPSAITPVDRDSDGYLDTIYFGNVAGHMFKTDISASAPASWKTYELFKKDLSTYTASNTISSRSGITVTLGSATGFALHQNVFGLTSKAMGTIDAVNNKVLTIGYMPGSPLFVVGETIVVPKFDPIFLSPVVFFDSCYNLWAAFGTGDRLRSRTNPDSGKFACLRDGTAVVGGNTVQKTDLGLGDLVQLTWSGSTLSNTNIKVANKWGWYFDFPFAANHEKLFDPEPLVLPDQYLVPHIFFNTYQPPTASGSEDCNAPKEGKMYFYDLTMNYCGNGLINGTNESGRIAGGGMFENEYILPIGTGNVASIPPLQEIKPIKLLYTGGLLFWKEKKR
jgi:hypothetical protein